MATADEYAGWIVKNAGKKGTPEFDTVAAAYKEASAEEQAMPPTQASITPARAGASLVDQIPGPRGVAVPNQTPTAEKAPAGMSDRIRGVIETPGVLFTGALGQFAGNVAGPIQTLREGTFGTSEGTRRAQQVAQEVAGRLSYAPRTETGANIVQNIGDIATQSGIAGINPAALSQMSVLGAPAARQASAIAGNKAALIKPAVAAVFEAQKARTAAANVAKSFENAAEIDAAKAAVKRGIVLDPAVSNPTRANLLKAKVVNSTNFNQNAAKINDAQFTRLARTDMGLPATTFLDADAFNKALDMHSKPYDAVRNLPSLAPNQAVSDQLTSLKVSRPAIGGEASAAAVNNLVDEAMQKVAQGRSGAEIITDIRKLRKDANSIYSAQRKSGLPDPTVLAKADANIGVANALESLIDANVSDPKLLNELRKSRAAMAKVYDYQRATNPLTGRIDPQALVQLAKEGKPLSAIAADIAKIAGVFPDVAKTGVAGVPEWAKGLTRSSAAGSMGAMAALAIGAPVLPTMVGSAVVGYLGGGLTARRMASPAYQAKNVVPRDFRPSVNKLAPENQNKLRND